jgi:hypothetical protein
MEWLFQSGFVSMEWLLCVFAPFMLGAIWGLALGSRDRFSIAVLVAAPLMSVALVCGGIVIVGVLSGEAPINPDNPNPLIVQWLAFTCLYALGIGAFGAVPAMLGSAGGELAKLAIVRHFSVRSAGTKSVAESDLEPLP